MPARDVAVVLVAAGRGERLGAGIPKAFVSVAERTLLQHAIENIAKAPSVHRLVVVAPASHLDEAARITRLVQLEGLSVELVVGGATRQESIANGLEVLDATSPIVLVHDSARALASADLFERVAASVRETGLATIPVMPISDTVKHVVGETVQETVDRSSLRLSQTPQGFESFKLFEAYASASEDFTDDAALYQAAGGEIRHVLGEANAFKITTQHDLAAANRIFTSNREEMRVGIGIDVHRFADDQASTLWLGCVEWPGERGLEGHSDGDAIAHAIVDALLSAAGLGDIGTQFGVDRAEYAGASGRLFLEGTLELLNAAGFAINNVAVEVVGNKPKIGPRRAELEATLSGILGAAVSVGATTTDGLGFLGNSEGLAAVANASIYRIGRLAS